MTSLEIRYRRLLRAYPAGHRVAYEEEMVGVLMRIWRPAGRMALPIGVYVLLFMVLVWLTLGLADPLVFIGATLFIFSDIVLTIRKYWTGPDHPIDSAAAYVVWVTYYAAQVILTLTLSET